MSIESVLLFAQRLTREIVARHGNTTSIVVVALGILRGEMSLKQSLRLIDVWCRPYPSTSNMDTVEVIAKELVVQECCLAWLPNNTTNKQAV